MWFYSTILGIYGLKYRSIKAGKRILERIKINACLAMRGSKGFIYVSKNLELCIPSKAKNVLDVSGA